MSKEIVFEERKLIKLPVEFPFEESYTQMAGEAIAKQVDDAVFSMLEDRTGLPVELLMANCEEAILEHRKKHPEKWNI